MIKPVDRTITSFRIQGGNILNVFIADDSDIVRDELKNLVNELDGVKIIGEARDAEEAAQKLNCLDADLVILDIRMPGGNGMAVLKQLVAKKIPPVIIIYTSFPHEQYRKAYLNAGATYFFDKTNDTDNLLQTIRLQQTRHIDPA